MELNIDLGHKMEGPCCTSEPTKAPEKYYPSFTYDGDSPMDGLPKEGEMTVYYKKVASSEHTNSDGKTRYSCTIEIRKIESVEGDEDDVKAPASNRSKEAGEALDALVAAVKAKY